MTEHDGFRVERDTDRATATITLDVSGKFNRVSMPARDELRAVFEELDRDDAIRFIVLTGAGDAFTAGGDIPGFLERSPWHVSRLADNVAAPERCTKPPSCWNARAARGGTSFCNGRKRPTSTFAATSTAFRPVRVARTKTGCAPDWARRCGITSRRTTSRRKG